MTQPFPGLISFFSTLDQSITISPIIILALAGIFTIIGIVFALLFEYHWKAYGVDKIEMLRVRFWYYTGSAIFGIGMLVSALLYMVFA